MEDFDTSALPGTSGGAKPQSLRLPRWLAGVCVILVLTFVSGFYWPLKNANDERVHQVKRLSHEYYLATQAYEGKTRELAELRGERDALKGELGNIETAETSAERELSALLESFESALRPRIDRKQLSVEKGKTSIKVVLEGMYLMYPGKSVVHKHGAALLCEIAKAIPKSPAHPTQVIARANGTKPWSTVLENQFETSWQLSAGLASEVSSEIETCGVLGTELRAVGAAHFEGEPKEAKKSAARIEIFVYPPKA
jgi:hypothetical protein